MPLKAMLPDYKRIEQRVDHAIRAVFGLPPVCSPEVKRADLILLATERRDLMPLDPEPWPILQGIEPLGKPIRPLRIAEAMDRFWQSYCEIRAAVDA